jgi:hypothetical protein
MFPSMHRDYGIRTGLVQMKDVSCNATRSLQSVSLYLLLLTRSFVHISGLNNNQAPAYMTSNPTTWMFNDQNSCCKKYYPWSLAKCMSIASVSPTTSSSSGIITTTTTTIAPGSGKWYMNWSKYKCVKDCIGGFQCGGLAKSWDQLYTTQSACCADKAWWNSDCAT